MYWREYTFYFPRYSRNSVMGTEKENKRRSVRGWRLPMELYRAVVLGAGVLFK